MSEVSLVPSPLPLSGAGSDRSAGGWRRNIWPARRRRRLFWRRPADDVGSLPALVAAAAAAAAAAGWRGPIWAGIGHDGRGRQRGAGRGVTGRPLRSEHVQGIPCCCRLPLPTPPYPAIATVTAPSAPLPLPRPFPRRHAAPIMSQGTSPSRVHRPIFVDTYGNGVCTKSLGCGYSNITALSTAGSFL